MSATSAAIFSVGIALAHASFPAAITPKSPTGNVLGDRLVQVHFAKYAFDFCRGTDGFAERKADVEQRWAALQAAAKKRGKITVVEQAAQFFARISSIMSPPPTRCEGGLSVQAHHVLNATTRAQSALPLKAGRK